MAISASTVGGIGSDIGGAVSDLFGAMGAKANAKLQAQGYRLKAQGDLAEAQQYNLAAGLAAQNEQYTELSTAIQRQQELRNAHQQIGAQQAEIAGAGFGASGSALDIMRESAQQGSLAQQVLEKQGLITEAGYQEQQQSFQDMSKAATQAAGMENEMAGEAESAGNTQAMGDYIGSAIKGATAIAALAVAL